MKLTKVVVRIILLVLLVVSVGLIKADKTKAASCTGAGWNCWTYHPVTHICLDQGDDKPCALNSGGTACWYDETGCCAESGQSCTYTGGGGGGGCSPISCGTQTCDCNTQQCCFCGC